MKKLIKNIVLLPFLVLGMSSCTDWLEMKPKTSIVLEDMWKDQTDVEAVLASCYNRMLQNDFMLRVMAFGELRSDNILQNESPSGKGKDTREMYKSVSLSSIVEKDNITSWAPFYSVIKLCNFVITYAPGVCDVDPDYLDSEMRAHVAQARALRALCYFYLVRTYKEFPYVDKPVLDDTENLMVSAVPADDVLKYIIADLEYAEKYAQTLYSSEIETRCRITRNAAKAMLADVYLWKASGQEYPHDSISYDIAIKYCDAIFQDTMKTQSSMDQTKNLMLATGYSNIFVSPVSTYENLFVLYSNRNTMWEQTKEDDLVQINLLYGSPGSSGTRGDWVTTYKVFPNDKYTKAAGYTSKDFVYHIQQNTEYTASTNDARFLNNMSGLSIITTSGYPIQKYEGIYASLSNYPSWIFYRLAEVYLMKAEAIVERMNARFDFNEDGQLIYLNTAESDVYIAEMRKAHQLVGRIYKRSNRTNTTSPTFTPATESELVYAERRRELVFEGKRWFDLFRMARRDNKRTPETPTKGVIDHVKTKMEEGADLLGSRLSSMDAMYWPIYKDELERNSSLVQNPYYVSETDNYQK